MLDFLLSAPQKATFRKSLLHYFVAPSSSAARWLPVCAAILPSVRYHYIPLKMDYYILPVRHATPFAPERGAKKKKKRITIFSMLYGKRLHSFGLGLANKVAVEWCFTILFFFSLFFSNQTRSNLLPGAAPMSMRLIIYATKSLLFPMFSSLPPSFGAGKRKTAPSWTGSASDRSP